MKSNKKKMIISMTDVRKSMRKPLPRQTGGPHKVTRTDARPIAKAKLMRGQWD